MNPPMKPTKVTQEKIQEIYSIALAIKFIWKEQTLAYCVDHWQDEQKVRIVIAEAENFLENYWKVLSKYKMKVEKGKLNG